MDYDDANPLQIYGNNDNSSNYQTLDAILTPCNYLHKEIDPDGVYTVSDECISSPEE